MATLVLTAVGTALGGPIGGALGAMLGQGLDAQLFGPKARQGPRLTDLKVQTSSYGDAIARIYGRLRVAGTVIWATDLIERRSKRSAGKGRPKTVEYSYSASLAVALSSRPIQGVGRIWADGKLLRDAGGQLAEQMQLRLYLGSEDQAVDPLIASSLGTARSSAFRGIAYAMIEELDLTAFGNRIPQLSFEVIAEEAEVEASAVAADITALPAQSGGPRLAGYAVGGGRVGELVRPLADWAALGVELDQGAVRLAPAYAWDSGAVIAPADASAARVHGAALLRAEEDRRAAMVRVAAAVQVRHYDPARDYQTSQQQADVAGAAAAAQTIELPAALTADVAQRQVRMLALLAAEGRRQVNLLAGMGALTLPLGRIVRLALAGEAERRWRIAERTVGDDGVRLVLVEHSPPVEVTQAVGDGGAAVAPPALGGGEVTIAIFDAPGDGEAVRSAPLRLVAAASSDPDWRGADLWWLRSPDAEGEPLGRISSAAAMGQLQTALVVSGQALIDRRNNVDVIMTNPAMQLQNCDMAALLAGANLAMIGDEAVQFERAEPLDGRRWRLSGLLRGRGGSAVVHHPAGTAFTLLDDPALVPLPDRMATEAASGGSTIEWRSRGAASMQQTAVPSGEQAVKPLAPVHGRITVQANGDVLLRWTARSRAGARWRDAVDGPIGGAVPRWRIEWQGPGALTESRESGVAEILLVAASFLPGSAVHIRQVGDFAMSDPLMLTLP